MNHEQTLFSKLQTALEGQDWDGAEALLLQAQAEGFTHDLNSVPLGFLQKHLPNLRRATANKQAAELMAEAVSLADSGQVQLARERYNQAIALDYLDPLIAEQIDAALAMLNTTDDFDPEMDRTLRATLVQLLDRIDAEQPSLAKLLRACAIPLWWDESLLVDIRNRHDGRESVILRKMSQLSFILQWTDHYVYNRLARPLLLSQWERGEWNDQANDFTAINHRIINHFQQRLDEDVNAEHVGQYARWEISYLYHLLLDDPRQGTEKLLAVLQQAEDSYQPDRVHQYVLVLQEIQDRLPPEYRPYIVYAEGWMHTLQGRHQVAQACFEELLSNDDLLPGLRAHIQRHLGAVLVKQGKWSQAVSHYQQALDHFEKAGLTHEVADTMERLGSAYMDIAASVYSYEDHLEDDSSWTTRLLQMVGLIGYLPLILYMLWNFDLGWNPRAWWRWGDSMDWAIAKFFANGIKWLQKAERIYAQLGNTRGLNHVCSSLGQLYLNLHYTDKAATIFHGLESEHAQNTYQLAHTRLYLATALAEQGKHAAAQALLQKTLPVFNELGHNERIAQTQTLLGKLAVRDDETDPALEAYAEALTHWLVIDDQVMATAVVHSMETLASSHHGIGSRSTKQVVSEHSQELLEQAQLNTSERVYESRFVHPLMQRFQQIALVLFCFLLPWIMWASINSQAGTNIGTTATLDRPPQEMLNDPEIFGPTVKTPEVTQVIKKTITPQVHPKFWGWIIMNLLLAYLILYTIIGLYLLSHIEISDVESHQKRKLYINDNRIRSFGTRLTSLLQWPQIRVYLSNNKRLLQWPMNYWSRIALIGQNEHIQVDGYTKGYRYIIRWIQQYLPADVQHVDIGFSLLKNFLGWLVVISAILLAAFIGAILQKPDSLTATGYWGYSFTDFYNLIFLGFHIPLLFWFILQPLRGYLVYQTNRVRQLWIIAWVTLALAGLSWLQFSYSILPFNRPDILLTIVVIFLGCFVLHQLYTMQPSRLCTAPIIKIALIAILSISIASWLTMQELISFHYLVQANNIFHQAAETKQQEEYQLAIDAYREAHKIRPTAHAFNSLGNLHGLLSQHEEAVVAYEKAVKIAPQELIYRKNLALAYQEWAVHTNNDATNRKKKIGRFEKAFEFYSQVINDIKREQRDYPYQKRNNLQNPTYELRAATYFRLAQIYYDLDKADEHKETYLDYFEKAKKDYEWLIEDQADDPLSWLGQFYSYFEPKIIQIRSFFAQFVPNYFFGNAPIEDEAKDPLGYVGLGWTLRYLQSSQPQNTPERREYLDQAIDAFDIAIALNENYASAYNGLGWTHYAISQGTNIRGSCNTQFKDEESKADYIHQIESAVKAFTTATTVDGGNGYFFKTRAQLQYILGFCGEPYDKITQYHKAIADYDIALKLEPRADWYYTLGMLHYSIGDQLDKLVNDGQTHQVLTDFNRAYQLQSRPDWDSSDNNPSERKEFDSYQAWQRQKGVDAVLKAIGIKPDYKRSGDTTPIEILEILYGKLGKNTDTLVDDVLATWKPEDQYDNLLLVIRSELESGSSRFAAQALQRAVEQNPQDSQPWLMLVQATFETVLLEDINQQSTAHQQSLDTVKQALEAGLENVELYTMLARIHAYMGNIPEAQKVLQQIEPFSAQQHYLQGLLHLFDGEEQAAELAYQAGNQRMQQTCTSIPAERIYTEAISDMLLLPMIHIDNPAQLKVAGDMALLVADAALESREEFYTHGDVAFQAAKSASTEKDYSVAILRYVKGLALMPDYTQAWYDLRTAFIYGYGMGHETSGAATLTAIIAQSDEGDPYDELIKVAESELSRDTFGLAVVALDKAQKLHLNDVDPIFLQANVYLRWAEKWPTAGSAPERYQKAVSDAQRVLDREPTNLEALLILTHGYMALDQEQEAAELAASQLRENPGDFQGLLIQAHIHFKGNEHDKAVAIIEDILDQDDRYLPAYLTLIGVYHKNGEYEKAASAAQKIIEIDPTNKDAYLAQGRLYRKYLYEYDQSLAAYRTAIELDALDYRTFWTMSWDVKYRGASPFLYNTFMANGRVLGYVGWNAYQNKEYALSVDASQVAIELMPDEPRHYANQGLAYVAMGDLDSAHASYLGWIKAANQPDNGEIRSARLNEAIVDLRDINADPEDAAQQFIDMLEAERDIENGP